MAYIYIRDEVLLQLDTQRSTPKGKISRNDYLKNLLEKDKK